MANTTFQEIKEKHIERLEQFTPIVERVHGEHHPEFFEVRRLFDAMNEKMKETEKPDLAAEFQELRKVTKDYRIPEGVCETYEAVYNMLEDLDKAYQA